MTNFTAFSYSNFKDCKNKIEEHSGRWGLKGGCLDCSHLTELEKIYISLKFIWKNNTNQ